MSRLYIRVLTGFYTHRKTIRLRVSIGDDAFWIPPRLWAYAAENQPDGDFSGYSTHELAMLLGCSKHKDSILKALKDAGFMDADGIIHGWHEHNGYHQKFSDRAKLAAAARWSKPKPVPPHTPPVQRIEKVESGDKHCSTDACSIHQGSKLDTPEFKAAWAEWQRARRKMKKPGDWEILFASQLKWLSDFDVVQATEILNQSIRNGYQGLFEPKASYGKNSKANSLNPAADRRNAGTIGHTDWGAVEKRKQAEQETERLAREKAEHESPPPPA